MNQGIEQSYTAQNHRCPNWGAQALGYMHRWVRTKPAQENWTIEHFRQYAESRGLEAPANGSAYGKIMSTASRNGLIEFVGFFPATRPTAHCRPLRVWRAA